MKISVTLIACLAISASAHAAPTLLQQFPVKAAPKTASKTRMRGAAQSKVALKSAFPTAPKASLKGALDVKNLAAAAKSVGKVALFSGVVERVYAPKSGAFVLLNFAKDYKTALVGSVRAKDFRVFPDLQNLKGKRVALRGKVVLYQGLPEIELMNAGAIRLVK